MPDSTFNAKCLPGKVARVDRALLIKEETMSDFKVRELSEFTDAQKIETFDKLYDCMSTAWENCVLENRQADLEERAGSFDILMEACLAPTKRGGKLAIKAAFRQFGK